MDDGWWRKVSNPRPPSWCEFPPRNRCRQGGGASGCLLPCRAVVRGERRGKRLWLIVAVVDVHHHLPQDSGTCGGVQVNGEGVAADGSAVLHEFDLAHKE